MDDPAKLASGELVAEWIGGGRTPHALIRFAGESWVLKAYRRGGFLGRWNSTRYWGTARFFRELEVAAHAEHAGVPTAPVLALILQRSGLGSVRSWLVTRYLPDTMPILEFLGKPQETQVFGAAGSVVAMMHRAGIDHPDLHLGNIVARAGPEEPRVFIVDWDRARRQESGSWNPHRNLLRLWRSLQKSRRLGRIERCSPGDRTSRGVVGTVPWESAAVLSFIRGYFRGRPGEFRAARQYFRRRAFSLRLRSLFWRRTK